MVCPINWGALESILTTKVSLHSPISPCFGIPAIDLTLSPQLTIILHRRRRLVSCFGFTHPPQVSTSEGNVNPISPNLIEIELD